MTTRETATARPKTVADIQSEFDYFILMMETLVNCLYVVELHPDGEDLRDELFEFTMLFLKQAQGDDDPEAVEGVGDG